MPVAKGAGYVLSSVNQKRAKQKTLDLIDGGNTNGRETTLNSQQELRRKRREERRQARGCRHCRRNHNVTMNAIECNVCVKCIGCGKVLASVLSPSNGVKTIVRSCCADFKGKLSRGGGGSLLRAARTGNLEKVISLLDNENVDIATCNSTGLTALHLAAKEGHCDVIEALLERGGSANQATKMGNTGLHIACLAGKLPVVKLLLEKNADPNVLAQNSFTPLYMAAQEGHVDIVSHLLEHGASHNISTEDGFTPLAVALQEGRDRVVAILLEKDDKGRVKLPPLHIAAKKDDAQAAALLLQNDNKADTTAKMAVNRTSESGFTALHIAAHYGNVSVAEVLLNRGAMVDFKAKNGITPMHVAAKRGHTRFCSLLLERHGRADLCTRDGLMPLHCAARSGHYPIVKLFLDNDNTPKQAKTKNGLSVLHMAAQGGHAQVVELLLGRGFAVDDVTSDYLSALHISSHCDHTEVVKLLLQHGAYVDLKALNGFTPLHVSCKKNRIEVVELLLLYHANKEALTESGLTPLHIACFMGHTQIVELLVERNAELNTVNVRGETALHMATRAGRTDIVTFLLRHGAKPDARKQESQTCLHLAARLDKVDIVKILIKNEAYVDETMADGYTPLHVAAREGHVEICEVLLENNASVALETKKGFTPLHLAAKYGRLGVANLLLKMFSSPDASGKDGLTPLHVAAHYDNQQVALLLLKNGASPHASGKNGYTPLHIAAMKNQMEIALTLLEYGASPNSKTKMDVTPLHLASQEGHTDMCSILLAKDANVNAPAKHGLTPMHLAAQEDRVSVAKLLYDNGALVDPLTRSGCTPLHIASHHGNINVANYLLSLEAKVNAKTKNGYTPLHQASQQGHTHVVNLLLKYGASPNELTNSGNTALSLAKRLGYVTLVDTLETVTTEITTTVSEEKRKYNIPETVNEGFLSDASDDEGDEHSGGGRFLTNDEMRELGDDSIVPTEASMFAVSKDMRYATLDQNATLNDGKRRSWSSSVSDDDKANTRRSPCHNGFLVSFMVDARGGAMKGARHPNIRVLIPPKACQAPTRVTCRLARRRPTLSRTPQPSVYDGEGRGGKVMEVGPRERFLDHHYNARNTPPMTEGEGLAAGVIQLAPKQSTFLGPVALEIPHHANVNQNNRQMVVLRSNDGETWKTHEEPCSDAEFRKIFKHEDLETADELAARRVIRIITKDFPRYFAVVSRPLEDSLVIGPSGGEIRSSVLLNAKAKFPEGSLTKKINVSMQVLPITSEVSRRAVGGKAKASSVLTIEPRRRKFHKPISLSIPLPEGTDMKEYLSSTDDSTLRLLCSISGGSDPAQWEDITGSTPLNFLDNCVSFTSTVSARFWLIDCRQPSESCLLANRIYGEATRVPYMAKFIVFAKSHDPLESKLRVFCTTDDKYERTLESQEELEEIARSKDVEIMEGSEVIMECSGNISSPLKPGQHHKCVFNSFLDNKIQLLAKVRDSTQDPCGRLTFYRLPMGSAKTHGPKKTLCTLNVKLPHCDRDSDSDGDHVSTRRKVGEGKPNSLAQEVAEAKRRYYLIDPSAVIIPDDVESSPEEIARDMVEVMEKLKQVKKILEPGVGKRSGGAHSRKKVDQNKQEQVGVKETTEMVMEVRDCLHVVKEILESGDELDAEDTILLAEDEKRKIPAVSEVQEGETDPHHYIMDGKEKLNSKQEGGSLEEVPSRLPPSDARELSELHGRTKRSPKDVEKISKDFDILSAEIDNELQSRRSKDILSVQFEEKIESLSDGSKNDLAPFPNKSPLSSSVPLPVSPTSSSGDPSNLKSGLIDFLASDLQKTKYPSLQEEQRDTVNEISSEVILHRDGVNFIDNAIRDINCDEELTRLLSDDLDRLGMCSASRSLSKNGSFVEERDVAETKRSILLESERKAEEHISTLRTGGVESLDSGEHENVENVDTREHENVHSVDAKEHENVESVDARGHENIENVDAREHENVENVDAKEPPITPARSVRFFENVTVIDDASISPLHALNKNITLQSSIDNVSSDRSSDIASVESDSDTGSVSFSPPLSDSESSYSIEDEVADEHPITLQQRIKAYEAATTKLHEEVERFKKITSPPSPTKINLSSEFKRSSSEASSEFKRSPSERNPPRSPKHQPLQAVLKSENLSDNSRHSDDESRSKEHSPVVVEEHHSVHELLKAWESVQSPSGSPIKSPARSKHLPSSSSDGEYERLEAQAVEQLQGSVALDAEQDGLVQQSLSSPSMDAKSDLKTVTLTKIEQEVRLLQENSEVSFQCKGDTEGDQHIEDPSGIANKGSNILHKEEIEVNEQISHFVPSLSPREKDISIKVEAKEEAPKASDSCLHHMEELNEFEVLEQNFYREEIEDMAQRDIEDSSQPSVQTAPPKIFFEKSCPPKPQIKDCSAGGSAHTFGKIIEKSEKVAIGLSETPEPEVESVDGSDSEETNAATKSLYLVPELIISKCSQEELNKLDKYDVVFEQDEDVTPPYQMNELENFDYKESTKTSSMTDLKHIDETDARRMSDTNVENKKDLYCNQVKDNDFSSTSLFEASSESCDDADQSSVDSRPRVLSDITERSEQSTAYESGSQSREISPQSDSSCKGASEEECDDVLSSIPEAGDHQHQQQPPQPPRNESTYVGNIDSSTEYADDMEGNTYFSSSSPPLREEELQSDPELASGTEQTSHDVSESIDSACLEQTSRVAEGYESSVEKITLLTDESSNNRILETACSSSYKDYEDEDSKNENQAPSLTLVSDDVLSSKSRDATGTKEKLQPNLDLSDQRYVIDDVGKWGSSYSEKEVDEDSKEKSLISNIMTSNPPQEEKKKCDFSTSDVGIPTMEATTHDDVGGVHSNVQGIRETSGEHLESPFAASIKDDVDDLRASIVHDDVTDESPVFSDADAVIIDNLEAESSALDDKFSNHKQISICSIVLSNEEVAIPKTRSLSSENFDLRLFREDSNVYDSGSPSVYSSQADTNISKEDEMQDESHDNIRQPSFRSGRTYGDQDEGNEDEMPAYTECLNDVTDQIVEASYKEQTIIYHRDVIEEFESGGFALNASAPDQNSSDVADLLMRDTDFADEGHMITDGDVSAIRELNPNPQKNLSKSVVGDSACAEPVQCPVQNSSVDEQLKESLDGDGSASSENMLRSEITKELFANDRPAIDVDDFEISGESLETNEGSVRSDGAGQFCQRISSPVETALNEQRRLAEDGLKESTMTSSCQALDELSLTLFDASGMATNNDITDADAGLQVTDDDIINKLNRCDVVAEGIAHLEKTRASFDTVCYVTDRDCLDYSCSSSSCSSMEHRSNDVEAARGRQPDEEGFTDLSCVSKGSTGGVTGRSGKFPLEDEKKMTSEEMQMLEKSIDVIVDDVITSETTSVDLYSDGKIPASDEFHVDDKVFVDSKDHVDDDIHVVRELFADDEHNTDHGLYVHDEFQVKERSRVDDEVRTDDELYVSDKIYRENKLHAHDEHYADSKYDADDKLNFHCNTGHKIGHDTIDEDDKILSSHSFSSQDEVIAEAGFVRDASGSQPHDVKSPHVDLHPGFSADVEKELVLEGDVSNRLALPWSDKELVKEDVKQYGEKYSKDDASENDDKDSQSTLVGDPVHEITISSSESEDEDRKSEVEKTSLLSSQSGGFEYDAPSSTQIIPIMIGKMQTSRAGDDDVSSPVLSAARNFSSNMKHIDDDSSTVGYGPCLNSSTTEERDEKIHKESTASIYKNVVSNFSNEDGNKNALIDSEKTVEKYSFVSDAVGAETKSVRQYVWEEAVESSLLENDDLTPIVEENYSSQDHDLATIIISDGNRASDIEMDISTQNKLDEKNNFKTEQEQSFDNTFERRAVFSSGSDCPDNCEDSPSSVDIDREVQRIDSSDSDGPPTSQTSDLSDHTTSVQKNIRHPPLKDMDSTGSSKVFLPSDYLNGRSEMDEPSDCIPHPNVDSFQLETPRTVVTDEFSGFISERATSSHNLSVMDQDKFIQDGCQAIISHDRRHFKPVSRTHHLSDQPEQYHAVEAEALSDSELTFSQSATAAAGTGGANNYDKDSSSLEINRPASPIPLLTDDLPLREQYLSNIEPDQLCDKQLSGDESPNGYVTQRSYDLFHKYDEHRSDELALQKDQEKNSDESFTPSARDLKEDAQDYEITYHDDQLQHKYVKDDHEEYHDDQMQDEYVKGEHEKDYDDHTQHEYVKDDHEEDHDDNVQHEYVKDDRKEDHDDQMQDEYVKDDLKEDYDDQMQDEYVKDDRKEDHDNQMQDEYVKDDLKENYDNQMQDEYVKDDLKENYDNQMQDEYVKDDRKEDHDNQMQDEYVKDDLKEDYDNQMQDEYVKDDLEEDYDDQMQDEYVKDDLKEDYDDQMQDEYVKDDHEEDDDDHIQHEYVKDDHEEYHDDKVQHEYVEGNRRADYDDQMQDEYVKDDHEEAHDDHIQHEYVKDDLKEDHYDNVQHEYVKDDHEEDHDDQIQHEHVKDDHKEDHDDHIQHEYVKDDLKEDHNDKVQHEYVKDDHEEDHDDQMQHEHVKNDHKEDHDDHIQHEYVKDDLKEDHNEQMQDEYITDDNEEDHGDQMQHEYVKDDHEEDHGDQMQHGYVKDDHEEDHGDQMQHEYVKDDHEEDHGDQIQHTYVKGDLKEDYDDQMQDEYVKDDHEEDHGDQMQHEYVKDDHEEDHDDQMQHEYVKNNHEEDHGDQMQHEYVKGDLKEDHDDQMQDEYVKDDNEEDHGDQMQHEYVKDDHEEDHGDQVQHEYVKDDHEEDHGDHIQHEYIKDDHEEDHGDQMQHEYVKDDHEEDHGDQMQHEYVKDDHEEDHGDHIQHAYVKDDHEEDHGDQIQHEYVKGDLKEDHSDHIQHEYVKDDNKEDHDDQIQDEYVKDDNKEDHDDHIQHEYVKDDHEDDHEDQIQHEYVKDDHEKDHDDQIQREYVEDDHKDDHEDQIQLECVTGYHNEDRDDNIQHEFVKDHYKEYDDDHTQHDHAHDYHMEDHDDQIPHEYNQDDQNEDHDEQIQCRYAKGDHKEDHDHQIKDKYVKENCKENYDDQIKHDHARDYHKEHHNDQIKHEYVKDHHKVDHVDQIQHENMKDHHQEHQVDEMQQEHVKDYCKDDHVDQIPHEYVTDDHDDQIKHENVKNYHKDDRDDHIQHEYVKDYHKEYHDDHTQHEHAYDYDMEGHDDKMPHEYDQDDQHKEHDYQIPRGYFKRDHNADHDNNIQHEYVKGDHNECHDDKMQHEYVGDDHTEDHNDHIQHDNAQDYHMEDRNVQIQHDYVHDHHKEDHDDQIPHEYVTKDHENVYDYQIQFDNAPGYLKKERDYQIQHEYVKDDHEEDHNDRIQHKLVKDDHEENHDDQMQHDYDKDDDEKDLDDQIQHEHVKDDHEEYNDDQIPHDYIKDDHEEDQDEQIPLDYIKDDHEEDHDEQIEHEYVKDDHEADYHDQIQYEYVEGNRKVDYDDQMQDEYVKVDHKKDHNDHTQHEYVKDHHEEDHDDQMQDEYVKDDNEVDYDDQIQDEYVKDDHEEDHDDHIQHEYVKDDHKEDVDDQIHDEYVKDDHEEDHGDQIQHEYLKDDHEKYHDDQIQHEYVRDDHEEDHDDQIPLDYVKDDHEEDHDDKDQHEYVKDDHKEDVDDQIHDEYVEGNRKVDYDDQMQDEYVKVDHKKDHNDHTQHEYVKDHHEEDHDDQMQDEYVKYDNEEDYDNQIQHEYVKEDHEKDLDDHILHDNTQDYQEGHHDDQIQYEYLKDDHREGHDVQTQHEYTQDYHNEDCDDQVQHEYVQDHYKKSHILEIQDEYGHVDYREDHDDQLQHEYDQDDHKEDSDNHAQYEYVIDDNKQDDHIEQGYLITDHAYPMQRNNLMGDQVQDYRNDDRDDQIQCTYDQDLLRQHHNDRISDECDQEHCNVEHIQHDYALDLHGDQIEHKYDQYHDKERYDEHIRPEYAQDDNLEKNYDRIQHEYAKDDQVEDCEGQMPHQDASDYYKEKLGDQIPKDYQMTDRDDHIQHQYVKGDDAEECEDQIRHEDVQFDLNEDHNDQIQLDYDHDQEGHVQDFQEYFEEQNKEEFIHHSLKRFQVCDNRSGDDRSSAQETLQPPELTPLKSTDVFRTDERFYDEQVNYGTNQEIKLPIIQSNVFDNETASAVITSHMKSMDESIKSLSTPMTADSLGEVSAGDEFSFRHFPAKEDAPLSVDSTGTIFQFSSSEVFSSEQFYSTEKLSSVSPKIDTTQSSDSLQQLGRPIRLSSPLSSHFQREEQMFSETSFASPSAPPNTISTPRSEIIHYEELFNFQRDDGLFTLEEKAWKYKKASVDEEGDNKDENPSSTSLETVVSQEQVGSFSEKLSKFVETIEKTRHVTEVSETLVPVVPPARGIMDVMDTKTARAQAARFEDLSYMSMAYDDATSGEYLMTVKSESDSSSAPLGLTDDAVSCKKSEETMGCDSFKCGFLETPSADGKGLDLRNLEQSSNDEITDPHHHKGFKPKRSRIPVAKGQSSKESAKKSMRSSKRSGLSKSLPTRSRKTKLDKDGLRAHDEITASSAVMMRASSASKLPVRKNSLTKAKKQKHKMGKMNDAVPYCDAYSTVSESSSGSNFSMKFQKSGGSSPVQESIFRGDIFSSKPPLNSEKYIALRDGVYTYKTSPALEKEEWERNQADIRSVSPFSASSDGTRNTNFPRSSHDQHHTSMRSGNKLSSENPFLEASPGLQGLSPKAPGTQRLITDAHLYVNEEHSPVTIQQGFQSPLTPSGHRSSAISIPSVSMSSSRIRPVSEELPPDSLNSHQDSLNDEDVIDPRTPLSSDSLDCDSVIREVEAEADVLSITPDSINSSPGFFPNLVPGSLEHDQLQSVCHRYSSVVAVNALKENTLTMVEECTVSSDSLDVVGHGSTNDTSDRTPYVLLEGGSSTSSTSFIQQSSWMTTSSWMETSHGEIAYPSLHDRTTTSSMLLHGSRYDSESLGDTLPEQKRQKVAAELGIQWPQLAGALGLSPDDVWKVQKQCDGSAPGTQSSAMLRMWAESQGEKATDEKLIVALEEIDRKDLIAVLNEPVFEQEDCRETQVDGGSRYDSSGFNALAAELGSPFPASAGHVSSPYPFTAARPTRSTSTPSNKARIESSGAEPTPSAGETDDPTKPHFIYGNYEDDDTIGDAKDSDDVATSDRSADSRPPSRGSSIVSSSTTSGEHEMNDAEGAVVSPPVEGTKEVENENVPDVLRRPVGTSSVVSDDIKVETQTTGDVTITTATRTITVESEETSNVSLPDRKVEVSHEGSHTIEVSRQVKRTVVTSDDARRSSDDN